MEDRSPDVIHIQQVERLESSFPIRSFALLSTSQIQAEKITCKMQKLSKRERGREIGKKGEEEEKEKRKERTLLNILK